jgi:DNA polymerase/3'-5' exonuclease PolX
VNHGDCLSPYIENLVFLRYIRTGGFDSFDDGQMPAREGMMKHSLTDIRGIGESTVALLAEHGIDSVKALRKAGKKKLARIPGFGEKRAAATLAATEALKDADKLAEKEAKKAAKAEAKAAKKAEKDAMKAAKAEAKTAKKAKKKKG